MTEMSRKYGHLYSARIGPFLVGVVINDAKLFRKFLIDNGQEFADRGVPPLVRRTLPVEGELLLFDTITLPTEIQISQISHFNLIERFPWSKFPYSYLKKH